MSKAEKTYDNIYLFQVEQPADGFAVFGYVYKFRGDPMSRSAAAAEIEKGPNTQEWEDVTKMHARENFNMLFAPNTEGLVFVRLPITNPVTVFGDKKVVDLNVKRNGSKKIVRACKLHPNNGVAGLICSFEINIPDAVADIGGANNHHAIARLPIMFDFVDTDGVSPVFKDPRHKRKEAVRKQERRHRERANHLTDDKNHGGIHPPSGSSLILVA
ncbi:hypothetical protein K3181_04230 [Qipengyuania sp. YG27]|uniref:Uncharacterized protein n=1 Tax=Qipengyuania mesophila TaxID=2867246 RepID=A0ABS7JSR3_9SPHN|nr:hypothetical protein [Qipengyuania mesophila]MBX7500643.1 hypothetical protein [Qipengyuania mesophila]